MMPTSTARKDQIKPLALLDQTSTAAPKSRENQAVETVKRQRQHDIDDGDGAGGRVVTLLDRFVVNEQRQRDHALGTDEQDDAELVHGQQQAQAAAGKQRRQRRREYNLAD